MGVRKEEEVEFDNETDYEAEQESQDREDRTTRNIEKREPREVGVEAMIY